jgi:hypothetical protein
VSLADGQTLHFVLTGATTALGGTDDDPRREDHLRADVDADRNLWITVRTDVLFEDIRDSVREAGSSAPLQHFASPTKGPPKATSEEVASALRDGGHFAQSARPVATPLGQQPTMTHVGVPTGIAQMTAQLMQAPPKK